MFPNIVSYNRFVELQKEVAVPLAIFIKKVLLGRCTGVSFVDSTPVEGMSQPAHPYPQGVPQRSAEGQMLHGMVLRIQAVHRMQ